MSNSRGYGIAKDIESEGFVGKYFPAGLNEGIILKSGGYGLTSTKPDADPNGIKALIFNFASEDGELTHRHIEWELVEKKELDNAEKLYDTLVSRGETPDAPKVDFINATVDKSYLSQQKRVKHILTKFMPEEKAVVPASNSFEQFSKNVEKLLTPAIKDQKLRAIMVYDNSGYVKFPTFVPFLEVMEDGKASLLKVNEKYHKLTPPTPKGGSNSAYRQATATVSQDDDF